MARIRGALTWLRHLILRREAEARMDEEIRFHLEMETRKNVARGMSAAEAARRARVAFGGADRHREALRGGRRLPVLEDAWQDVRFGMRGLKRAPGFAALAVFVLAIGIGASAAVFSVLDGVLLQELPVRGASELVVGWREAPARGAERLPFLYADLRAIGESSRALAGVAGVMYQGTAEQVLLDGDRAVTAHATWVTGDFFPVLGVTPARGRMLGPADDVVGAAPVLVISHGFWRRYFGGDARAVGARLQWNGKSFTVVGVLPPGLEYPARAEVWAPAIPDFPATLEPEPNPAGMMVFDLVGRLAPGSSAAEARSELAAYIRAGDAERPPAQRGMTAGVLPLTDIVTGNVRATLWAAFAAVALLLVIACVNVANLLLIRGASRGQELSVRSALGAGRRRLVRQLLAEHTLLAVLGGVGGVVMAWAAVQLLLPLAPPELPRRDLVQLDGRVLAATAAVTVVTIMLAGLLPALLTAGPATAPLRGGTRTTPARGGLMALRDGLVVGQIALAVVVVISAGLLVRSLVALHGVDMGFNDERLLVMQAMLPADVLPEREQRVALQEAMVERVAALPGVAAAAALPVYPFSGQGGWTALYTAEGQTADAQTANPIINFEVVGPDYFDTLEVPLLIGRGFDAADREDSERVAVISGTLARQTWPGADPLGRRIKLGTAESPGPWHTVVGVAGETRYRDLGTPVPTLYLPVRQIGSPVPMHLAIRTTSEPGAVVPQLREALRQVHPSLVLAGGGTMRHHLARPLATPRFATTMFSTLALLTLMLAVVGIYGALSAMVRQRTREMGLRLALGARRQDVHRLVLERGLKLALFGCAIGGVVAVAATRGLRSLLYNVATADPVTYLGVGLLLLGAAVLACHVPARRASSVDPQVALRSD